MRDLRLSFWSSVYGCAGILCVLCSRMLSAYLVTHPVRPVFFLDPLNYLLVLGSLILLLQATTLASSSIKKLRTGKKILTAVQAILIFDIFYQVLAQVLHFTLSIDVNNSLLVLSIATVLSLPSVVGVYALYFSKQLRSNVQYAALGLFVLSVIWVILRLGEKIVIPLLEQHTDLPTQAMDIAKAITGINDVLSIILYGLAFIGIAVYAYFCARATLKMPEKD